MTSQDHMIKGSYECMGGSSWWYVGRAYFNQIMPFWRNKMPYSLLKSPKTHAV